MPFEGVPLDRITAEDLRRFVERGETEHLTLEYKAEPYKGNDEGSREHLQDVCMFANAQGGVILIGVQEKRDSETGQPTGAPDPSAPLGIEITNPESLL